MAVDDASPSLNERDDSQAALPDPPTAPAAPPDGGAPVRSRFLLLILLAGIPLCAAAGTTTWWMRKTYLPPAGAANAYEPPSARTIRYNETATLDLDSLTPEVMAVLDELAASFAGLDADLEAAERRRRAADPHLDRALNDPVGTPFRPDRPVLRSDIHRGFHPVLDKMVDEYAMRSRTAAHENAAAINALRRCLRAGLFGEPLAEGDVAVLQSLSNDADPLVLYCRYRCAAAGDPRDPGDRLELIKRAQFSREEQSVGAELGALISSSLLMYRSRLSQDEIGIATEAFINDFADIWRLHPSNESDFAAQDIYLTSLDQAFDSLNITGKIDLLLELKRRPAPQVPSFLVHFVAAKMLKEAAMEYRGGTYVSDVPPEDLKRFQDLAAASTKHLLKAWSSAPEHQLLAAQLMNLEMWSGTTRRSTDYWFRHAVSACFRKGLNFTTYETSVKEQWGGSKEKQLWLAEKYVETEDLEEGIAFRFAHPLSDYYYSAHGPARPVFADLRVRRIVDRFVRTLKSYSRGEPHPGIDSNAVPLAAAALWQAGEFADLDWLLGIYGGKTACGEFHFFRLHLDDVAKISQAILNDTSLAWHTAYRLLYGDTRRLSDRDLAQLEAAITELREGPFGADPKFTDLIAKLARKASLLAGIAANETVILSDADLGDWISWGESLKVSYPHRPSGKVPLSETTTPAGTVDLEMAVNQLHELLSCPVQIDLPISFSMDVEALETIETFDDYYGVSLLIGPRQIETERLGYNGVILTANTAHAQIVRDHLPLADWKTNVRTARLAEPQAKYSIRIDAFPDGYRTYLGEREIESVSTELHTGGLLHLGRFCNTVYPDLVSGTVKYRISNVRLRRPKVERLSQVTEFY